MVVPPGSSPNQPGQGPPDLPIAARPLTGYTVPSGWGSPPKLRAPGTVIAAAVLTYIRGGVGILASVLVFGASALAEAGPFLILGLTGLVVSGLYVAAALLLQLRAKRTFLLWLVIADLAIEAVSVVMDIAQVGTGRTTQGGGGLCSLILPIIVLALLRHRNTVEWVEARRAAHDQPLP